jgi:hypothetical protein
MATTPAITVKPLLNPASQSVTEVLQRRRHLDDLKGRTVCFWHDSTPEADVIYPVIREYLLEQGAAEVLLARQPAPASRPEPYNLSLVARADAAILGVAW